MCCIKMENFNYRSVIKGDIIMIKGLDDIYKVYKTDY